MSSTLTNSVLYGKGIFTTIAVRNSQPILWEKHLKRLSRDKNKIGLGTADLEKSELLDKLGAELEKSGIVDGRARITISDETPSPIWYGESAEGTSIHVRVALSRAIPAELFVTQSPFPVNSRSPLAGTKSCNYLENLLAIEEANRRGSQEAIRLNERGEVTSACMANIFWLSETTLYTPSLETGCLPGTTREHVLENIDCSEVQACVDDVRTADAIFLTSAGLGIIEVHEFDGKKFERSEHPIIGLWPPA